MLAVLHIALPFDLVLPTGTEYSCYAIQLDGYEVTVEVPARSDRPSSPEVPEHIFLNGKPALVADVLTVSFRRDSFNRQALSEIDPPATTINAVIKSFLERLKFVARAPQVRPIQFPQCRWHLSYLTDERTELKKEDAFIRGRGTAQFSFSYIACDPALWDQVFSLPHEFEAPPWHTLLVDSRGALPHVGTAVVLAATALEVFISDVLHKIATESTLPADLWGWITDRGDWQKEPSVEEQYSILLQVLCGHSLKEDGTLWEAFKNLRKARNSFVHEGVAMVGKKPLQASGAMNLIERADQIVSRVREWMPEEHRWPKFEHAVQMRFQKLIAPSKAEDDESLSDPPNSESA